jgi:DNA helicase II / ATP-dependent DNA helicase PcrA
MTLHTAKGLEYPGGVRGRDGGRDLPAHAQPGRPAEMEEERRLAYVGITRAQQRLFLTSAASRTLWGATNYNPASRFLKEIPAHSGGRVDQADPSGASERFTGPEHTVDASEIGPGDRVRHDKWGMGTVREVIGSGDKAQAVVNFDREGKKTLLLAWAPLTRA